MLDTGTRRLAVPRLVLHSYWREMTVRRIALLAVAVGALAAAATAWAVTNTVSYSVTIKKVGGSKATPKKPLRIAYNAVLHIDSDLSGSQPDTAPVTSIYFPKQIKQ